MASLITSFTSVYSTVHSDADEGKYESCASLAFVRGIHRRPNNSPQKKPVTRKLFPFDEVIITVEVRAWVCYYTSYVTMETVEMIMCSFPNPRLKQERLKRRITLGCLDQYAAQNSKYARPPIPSQPPTQKGFFQWHTQYDPTMKHSHCETVYTKELFQWLFFELPHSLRIPQLSQLTN